MATTAPLVIVLAAVLSTWSAAVPGTVDARPKDQGRDAASGEPTSVVVWDATEEADCRLSVKTDDGPWEDVRCGPGTVIASKPSTEAEARSVRRGEIVRLTGNPRQDEALVEEAVEKLRREAAPRPTARASSCRPADRSIRGSYDLSGQRDIQYLLRYLISSRCAVTGITDMARSNAAGNGEVFWERSCSNGSSGCRERNLQLYNSFFGPYVLSNARVGNAYRNEGTNFGCTICTTYRGFWTYD